MIDIIIGALIGGLVGYFIGTLIGEDEVQEQLREDDAFYGEIVDLQPNTVTIQEIDDDGDVIQYRKLETNEGVSEDLYEGEIIFAD